MREVTNAQLERLVILAEEAAEVQQMAMKTIRHGFDSYSPHDPSQISNTELLEREIGDLLFTIDLLIESGDINLHSIERFKLDKRSRIQRYLHHNLVNKGK